MNHLRGYGILAAAATAITCVACSTATSTAPPAASAPAASAPATSSSGVAQEAVPRPAHVVVVVMENHSYGDIIGSPAAPYINSLAARGADFTRSFAIAHPSEPNYLALFSGSTQGVTSDACPVMFNAPNLAAGLLAAGKTFAGYAEDMPAGGAAVCAVGNYARKHVPWTDFSNVPAAVSKPFTNWPAASYAGLPVVSFVIPNLCDDMHDCPVATGDAWLRAHLSGYADWAMTHDSLLIVTWDEDDGSASNQIPTIFVGQRVRPGRYSAQITHYSVLRTIEDAYGLPHDGAAATAQPITGIWTASNLRSSAGAAFASVVAEIAECHDGDAMRETTVQVEREQAVNASPEQVWALLGDLAAWSLLPGRFAFSLAPLPGMGRLCCLLVAGAPTHSAVLEACEEVAGQRITWQTRNTLPVAKQAFTLSVLPRGQATTARITVKAIVPRGSKVNTRSYWRKELTAWLDRLRAVIEGRLPWPQTGMPGEMQRACSARPILTSPLSASAVAMIEAPTDQVWEAVWAPETTRGMWPEHVADVGHVPGTPMRALGEMQYFISRPSGDQVTAVVHVVREVTEYRSALTQHVGPPYDEVLHLFSIAPGGTRLELIARWSPSESKRGGTDPGAITKHLQEQADAYKAVTEESSGESHRSP